MQKLLFFVVVVLIVWRLLINRKSAGGKRQTPKTKPAESMVVCARCGVYLPLSDSVEAAGRHYCCEAHRREAGAG